ncbi:hypothetical protein HAX54_003261 [Datura stramonium]|uniref:Uncharacterized protein n=1 Tax=Datura stramonium TaxID=4076 RepID=A0ABS8WW38_DATST|nr:hypothetical protein [Datura stramonium]
MGPKGLPKAMVKSQEPKRGSSQAEAENYDYVNCDSENSVVDDDSFLLPKNIEETTPTQHPSVESRHKFESKDQTRGTAAARGRDAHGEADPGKGCGVAYDEAAARCGSKARLIFLIAGSNILSRLE